MIGYLLLFILVALGFALAGEWLLPARSRAIDSRLKVVAGTGAVVGVAAQDRAHRTVLQRLARGIAPWVEGSATATALDRLLRRAGLAWRASEFLIAVVAGLVLGACTGRLFMGPFGLVLGAAAGAGWPFFHVHRLADRLMKALNDQLPDALMLMVNALRAGNSLTQAMMAVSAQMPAPIATSFGAALQEINYGLPIEEALAGLQDRFGGLDMALVASAIAIQRETGGNLAEILHNLHQTIRDRQTVQGEVRALTAQGRLSGWILSLLPVGIGFLFYLLNRSYIMTLFTDPRGQMLVCVSLVLTVIGMFAIRRIVDVAY